VEVRIERPWKRDPSAIEDHQLLRVVVMIPLSEEVLEVGFRVSFVLQ
jgi:hypothetical protein